MPHSLLIVHVDVSVVPEHVEAFLRATEANATASRAEPGIVRFDVITDRADPTHVVLVEIYHDEAAVDAHRQTAHYARWRDEVASMMARPRTRVQFVNSSPGDEDW